MYKFTGVHYSLSIIICSFGTVKGFLEDSVQGLLQEHDGSRAPSTMICVGGSEAIHSKGILSTSAPSSMEPEVRAAMSILLSTIWSAAHDLDESHAALGE